MVVVCNCPSFLTPRTEGGLTCINLLRLLSYYNDGSRLTEVCLLEVIKLSVIIKHPHVQNERSKVRFSLGN